MTTSSRSLALIPSFIETSGPRALWKDLLAILSGSLLMAALAQITIHLPFTPVPITGQTFGVSLLALGWGRWRALSAFLLYLAEGSLGLPVFATATVLGPTMGYLAGMGLATFVVGGLADRGSVKNFSSAFACSLVGSFMTFSLGLFGLSFFVPHEHLLAAGLYPFIPGDLVKTTLASLLAAAAYRSRKQNS